MQLATLCSFVKFEFEFTFAFASARVLFIHLFLILRVLGHNNQLLPRNVMIVYQ